MIMLNLLEPRLSVCCISRNGFRFLFMNIITVLNRNELEKLVKMSGAVRQKWVSQRKFSREIVFIICKIMTVDQLKGVGRKRNVPFSSVLNCILSRCLIVSTDQADQVVSTSEFREY